MKYLIAWPGKSVKNILKTDINAIFLDEYGWWFYSVEKCKRILLPLKFDPSLLEEDISVCTIRDNLDTVSPMLVRWFGQAYSYEILKYRSGLAILMLVSGLKLFEISFVIFHTGVPHHWDSTILSIACKQLNLKQIFLYCVTFEGSLLPLIQTSNIFSRCVFKFNGSRETFEHSLDEFVANKLINLPPKGTAKNHAWRLNYYVAVVLLVFWKIKSTFSLYLRKKINSHLQSSWCLQSNYLLWEELGIISAQHNFLKLYCKKQLSASDVIFYTTSASPRLLLAAHYQPEATSFPEGGAYHSHIDIITTIKLKGYNGDILYKEHPSSWLYFDNVVGHGKVGIFRSPDYINMLIELGAVLLPSVVPLSINENHCKWYIPITISGSIAIERSLVGLRTIVAGEPWFKNMPGIIRLEDICSLTNLDSSWTIPDHQLKIEARNFLLEKLNRNTLINLPGIGSGIPLVSGALAYKQFSTQLRNLIDKVSNE